MKKKIDRDLQAEVDKHLSEMLGFVDDKSILTFDKSKGTVFVGGEKVLPERLANLKAESEFLLNSDLWKLMNETIRYMAYDRMFIKSASFEDMQSGKMLLYHLDIQKKLMETFRSYQHAAPAGNITPGVL